MAGQTLDPSKLILPGNGTILHAPVGTEPFDLDAFQINDPSTFSGWSLFGHTSRENPPVFAKEGGEVTQKGTWEQSGVRPQSEPETYTFALNALEVARETLQVGFGGGSYDPVRRRYAVKEIQATDLALFLVMIDGTNRAGIDMLNTSIKVGDLPEIDVENFFEVQLLAQVLTEPTSGEKFGIWETRTYMPTPEAWAAETDYMIGDRVALSGGEVLEATSSGTSGTTEPTAPAVDDTVTDGTVTWIRIS